MFLVLLCLFAGIVLLVYSYHPKYYAPPEPFKPPTVQFSADVLKNRVNDIMGNLFVDRSNVPLLTRMISVMIVEKHQSYEEREMNVFVRKLQGLQGTFQTFIGASDFQNLITQNLQKWLLETAKFDTAMVTELVNAMQLLLSVSGKEQELKDTELEAKIAQAKEIVKKAMWRMRMYDKAAG